jgi:hypothetical protein
MRAGRNREEQKGTTRSKKKKRKASIEQRVRGVEESGRPAKSRQQQNTDTVDAAVPRERIPAAWRQVPAWRDGGGRRSPPRSQARTDTWARHRQGRTETRLTGARLAVREMPRRRCLRARSCARLPPSGKMKLVKLQLPGGQGWRRARWRWRWRRRLRLQAARRRASWRRLRRPRKSVARARCPGPSSCAQRREKQQRQQQQQQQREREREREEGAT